MSNTKGHENVCEPAVKYRFIKKLNVWCRTWFTIEKDDNLGNYFKQNNAFSKDRNTVWEKWTKSPNPER